MAQSLFLENDSPVEFLYLDRQRVASLAGQLSDEGVLTQYKATAGKLQNTEGQASGNIAIAKAEGKVARGFSESTERIYDPFWSHAYSFLQDLERNYAVPVENGRLGTLVRFEAVIRFLDLRIMRNLWEPSIRAFVQAQSSANPTGDGGRGNRKQREHRLLRYCRRK